MGLSRTFAMNGRENLAWLLTYVLILGLECEKMYWYINNLSVVYAERKWWMSGGENDLIIKICSGRIDNIVL